MKGLFVMYVRDLCNCTFVTTHTRTLLIDGHIEIDAAQTDTCNKIGAGRDDGPDDIDDEHGGGSENTVKSEMTELNESDPERADGGGRIG